MVASGAPGSPLCIGSDDLAHSTLGAPVIDLHLHTTASDGTCPPADLVDAAAASGLRVIAVADHDTLDATDAVSARAAGHGIVTLSAVEITAVHAARDVHVLGYFVEPTAPFVALLAAIRRQREHRARAIVDRLGALGAPIDPDALFSGPGAARSVARPKIARALVEAGHAESVADAFDRYLTEGRPAYVAHEGPGPADVVRAILEARGVASLAHPGTSRCDDLVGPLVDAGLGALEVFHSAHDDETRDRYAAMAARFGLEVTGGSDYHGPGTRRSEFFGKLGLPQEAFASFCRKAAERSTVPAAVFAACGEHR